MIKLASQKLFAFNEAELGYMTMNGIRQQAAFIFTQLTSLRIKQQPEILLTKKMIENFQKVGKLEFIALEFSRYLLPNLHELGRETLAQINSLQFNSFRIDNNKSTCESKDSGYNKFDELFLCGGELDADGRLVPGTTAWPALTQLIFNDFQMNHIDMRRLADFFPQLENLNIITQMRYCNLPLICTNDPFRAMNNIRVLKLDNVSIAGFGIIEVDCLPHLEKLYLRANESCSSNRIDSFPHFTKLTELSLHLNGEKQIFSPTAFDHLTQLTRFEIYNMVDGYYNNNRPFETGVAARFMSFHLTHGRLKLTSSSVSKIEEIELDRDKETSETLLETALSLSGLKRLTTSKWANAELPFHQMTNLECLKLKTSDLSIIGTGQLKCLAKLRVLEISSGEICNRGPFRFKKFS
jgi:hypothetical protein